MTQRGVAIWFTGLSGSGKSTLARLLESRLKSCGFKVEVLDGDEIRQCFGNDLGFSRKDRDANIRRVGYLTKLLTRNGVIVITAAISPYRAARDANRAELDGFVEVYCACPLHVLEARDPKGLYGKARRGELQAFTGVDDPYEPPIRPEIVVHTDREATAESLEKILEVLAGYGLPLATANVGN